MQNRANAPTQVTVNTNPALPQYPIESVDNALRLLLLFGEQQSVRLTEASRYLGIASSTAHRLLAMLLYHGFVRQDHVTKTYGPGPALTGVAFSVIARLDLSGTARPVMQRLNDEFDESIHLAVLEGAQVRFVEAIESRRAVRVASRLGRSLPAHCTSIGKAMLAELDAAELDRLFPGDDLPQMTGRSIADGKSLRRELAGVRRRGYATNREESEEGVASVAVAVPSQMPGMRTAISISAPISRLSASTSKHMARSLQDAAEELGQLFG
jgi:DNA-binding IclR family transcriptional regulator